MSHSSLNSSSNPNLFSPSKAAMEGPLQAPKIMDKGWEVIQKKSKHKGRERRERVERLNPAFPCLAFTNWINNKLKLKQVAPLDSIDTDFSSGEKLIQLLGEGGQRRGDLLLYPSHSSPPPPP